MKHEGTTVQKSLCSHGSKNTLQYLHNGLIRETPDTIHGEGCGGSSDGGLTIVQVTQELALLVTCIVPIKEATLSFVASSQLQHTAVSLCIFMVSSQLQHTADVASSQQQHTVMSLCIFVALSQLQHTAI